MAGMDKPQFSLLRLFGAVTCLAVAFAAWSFGARNNAFNPEWVIWLLILLIIAMPGIAVFLLSRRAWIGAIVSIAIFMILAVETVPARKPAPLRAPPNPPANTKPTE